MDTKSMNSFALLINVITNQYFSPNCVLQFSANSDFLQLNNVTSILLSSKKRFNFLDAGRYDQCKEIFIYKSHNPRQTFEEFERFIRKESSKLFWRRKYLFYINGHNETGEFKELFESSSLKFVTNILVITEDNSTSKAFYLYTHKYVGKSNNNEAVLLDIWNVENNSFNHGNDLFPDKISNQHGREIVVSAGTLLPQSHIEVNLLYEYAKNHNATIYFLKEEKFLGDVYKNWTGTGIMKAFIEDRADAVSYALYMRTKLNYGDSANQLSISKTICLVPKPKKLDAWMIRRIFKLESWIFCLFVYLVWYFVTKLFNYCFKRVHSRKTMEYLVIIRTLFGQTNTFSRFNHYKVIVTVILITTIILHIFFNSKLAVIIMKPMFMDKIETIEQLARSNLNWYSEFSSVARMFEFEEAEPFLTLYRNFRQIDQDDMYALDGKQFAYVIDVSRQYFYTIPPYFTIQRLENMQLMRGRIHLEYISLLFRRNSVLLPSFNKFLGKCRSTGITKFWELQAVYVANDTLRQIYLRQTKEVGQFSQLNVTQITGILLIWFCGLCLASTVFIFELTKKHVCTYVRSLAHTVKC